MHARTIASVAVLLCAVLLIAMSFGKIFQSNAAAVPGEEIRSIKIGGVDVRVDIADTPALLEQGLSGRMDLTDNTGMLFVFPQVGVYRFWMKDMLFPIDMVWISESGTVVYIASDVAPETYPQTFGPDTLAKYVLEVPAGFAQAHLLSIGDNVGL